MPATELLHDRVEVPDPPLIVSVLKLQTRLVESVVMVRVTVPVNPLVPLIVIVEVPEA